MFCSTCRPTDGKDRSFERPPCSDGHGEDCPELACTGCGAAFLSGARLPIQTQSPQKPSPQTLSAHAPSHQAPPTQNTPPAERSTSAPFRAA